MIFTSCSSGDKAWSPSYDERREERGKENEGRRKKGGEGREGGEWERGREEEGKGKGGEREEGRRGERGRDMRREERCRVHYRLMREEEEVTLRGE